MIEDFLGFAEFRHKVNDREIEARMMKAVARRVRKWTRCYPCLIFSAGKKKHLVYFHTNGSDVLYLTVHGSSALCRHPVA